MPSAESVSDAWHYAEVFTQIILHDITDILYLFYMWENYSLLIYFDHGVPSQQEEP